MIGDTGAGCLTTTQAVAVVGVTVGGAVSLFVGSGHWTLFAAATGLTLLSILAVWGPAPWGLAVRPRLAVAASYGIAVANTSAYFAQVIAERWPSWFRGIYGVTDVDCAAWATPVRPLNSPPDRLAELSCYGTQASEAILYVWIATLILVFTIGTDRVVRSTQAFVSCLALARMMWRRQ